MAVSPIATKFFSASAEALISAMTTPVILPEIKRRERNTGRMIQGFAT
jgi:hypothetical protein